MANIRLKELIEANVDPKLVARSKETGKLVYFKTPQNKDAAMKAGTHEDPKAKKGGQPKADAKPNDMFGGDYAKERGGETPKADLGVDKVVYNTRTKTVGIVRMPDERGETKTDADGNVNTDELEPYNPMKYPHQKDAKAAPSTSKEIDARGLWKPFAQSSNSGDWMDDLDSIDTSDIKGKANPDADSFTSGDLYGATFKDPQTGKSITVGDAYEREDDSEAYKKAFAYVSKFDPDKEAIMGTQAYDDLSKKAPSKDDVDISGYKTDGEGKVLYKGKKVADYMYDDITDEFTLKTKDGIKVFDTHNDMYKYLQKNKSENPSLSSKLMSMFKK